MKTKIFVCDTMAVVLKMEHRRLPVLIKELFYEFERGDHKLFIPFMALSEIGYLSERGRISTSINEVLEYMQAFPNIKFQNLDQKILEATFAIDDIPELHDRIIAASAVAVGATLITNDPIINGSVSLTCIWD